MISKGGRVGEDARLTCAQGEIEGGSPKSLEGMERLPVHGWKGLARCPEAMGPQTAALLFGASFVMCAKEAHILFSRGLACGVITRSDGPRRIEELSSDKIPVPGGISRNGRTCLGSAPRLLKPGALDVAHDQQPASAP